MSQEEGDSDSFALAIAAAGCGFSASIKAAIGPDGMLRIARERFVRGEIDVDELEARVDEALRTR